MAAKDYQICTGLFNAYIAKVRKKRPNMMTDDRRVITEGEILMLIDWYLDNELDEEHNTLSFNSQEREGKRVQLKYIDDEQKRRNKIQLSLPALKRLRDAGERGDLAGGLIESAERFGAGRACMRIVLKKKPWILTIEVRRK